VKPFARPGAAVAGGVSIVALAALSGFRLKRAERRLTDRWRHLAIEPRGSTQLGVSFRPLQAQSFGLDPRATLRALLDNSFEVVRLGAYWNRLEPQPGHLRTDELDWQIEAAEAAGKQIILCVGAVKAFGYPEFFVPAHHLPHPLPEGALVTPSTHSSLLAAATDFISRIVERYRDRGSIAAWQVEHEAVDPLGLEHSWRLATSFVAEEVAAARKADASRPIMMNGFLPTSLPVLLQQRWRTRDQGDSLAVARQLADTVGIDYYPRHALAGAAGWALYLDGGRRRPRLGQPASPFGPRLMITEGQAEPWEAVTIPPAPNGRGMYSCRPEDLVGNYNRCLSRARETGIALDAYLFWGAEYWILRQLRGDSSYLEAFIRVLKAA
jgi:hypothetical protein